MRSLVARALVFSIYVTTAAVVHASRLVRRALRRRPPSRPFGQMRLLVSGTFYNEGWLRSHIDPLTRAKAFERVYVVTDEPLFDAEKVVYVVPPRWAVRTLGRPLARTMVLMRAAARHRPDALMGYHIMPNALLCLVAASVFGGWSAYQMTGGPTQVIGGGARSENQLLRRLGRRSRLLERLLFHVIRQLDLVIVRGGTSRAFVREHDLGESLVVTGSVDTERFRPAGVAPEYDLVSVSRLAAAKGLDRLLRLAERLRRIRPELRVAIVGDGPQREPLEREARRLGITENVRFLGRQDDVVPILQRARVFVLASKSEGMSIAMLEAMGCGLPVAVTDVGDQRDVVEENVTGVFIDRDDPDHSAGAIDRLLRDESLRGRMATRARAAIVEHHSIEAIARQWDELFVGLAPGQGGSRDRTGASTVAGGR